MKMKGGIKSALKAYITVTVPGIYYHYFMAQHLSDTSQTQGMGVWQGASCSVYGDTRKCLLKADSTRFHVMEWRRHP